MTFIWTPPDPLNNKAKTRSIYMTELQAAANVKRVEIAQSQLSFINQNIGKKFVLSAVEELKTVVNQLAIDFGYPTGVEDLALLGRPYVTITKKYGKSVCHYPILNDLRFVLNALTIQVGLIFAHLLNHPTYGFDNVANLDITSGPLSIKYQFKPQFAWNPLYIRGVCCDNTYIYRIHTTPTTNTDLYKEDSFTGQTIIYKNISPWQAQDITVDENYIWLVGYIYGGYGSSNWQIKKLRKSDLTILSTHTIANQTTSGYKSLCNDKNNLYITGVDSSNIAEIRKYNKDTFSYITGVVDGHYIPDGPTRTTTITDMSLDKDNVYIVYKEERPFYFIPTEQYYSGILKLDKNTFDIISLVSLYNTNNPDHMEYKYSALSISKYYIYILPVYFYIGEQYKVMVFSKGGGSFYESLTIASQTLTHNSSEHLACNREEFEVVFS